VRAVQDAGRHHRKRVITATLNMVVREAVAWKAPPSQRGSKKQGRVYYATQVRRLPHGGPGCGRVGGGWRAGQWGGGRAGGRAVEE